MKADSRMRTKKDNCPGAKCKTHISDISRLHKREENLQKKLCYN